MALIESVPNFSEGRDRAMVDAIAEAMRLDGVYLLDRHMDADHNRSVITLAGGRDALMEAVLRGIGKAAELIDLTRHRGVHPRIGATDVVPFVPIEGVTLADCVQMARQVGRGGLAALPHPRLSVRGAATRPERVQLENIRRGQFEGLRDEIATNPARMPDFGEPRLHPTAGATVIGARKFLVAYNIFLEYRRCRNRPQNRPNRALLQRRLALRQSHGRARSRPGAGFHEPDRHRPNPHHARL